MKKQQFFAFVAILLTATLFTSCKKDDNPGSAPTQNSSGVYIVNEGSFGSGNSSISFYDSKSSTMFNNLFENVNGFPLGDLAQSMTIHGEVGYVVVNGSQKIEVVNINDFSSLSTITGFQGPRYMVVKGNKGYVSDWFSNTVVVINLTNHAIVNSITVGEGPEQMVISGNRLFVANVGGWGNDSTISVINLDTETLFQTITLGTNPNSLKIDKNGKLWILCGGSTGPDFIGGTADDTEGSLWRLDPATLTIELSLIMNAADHPSKLQINDDKNELFFLQGIDGYNGKIAKILVDSPSLPANLLANKEYYSLGIDPKTSTIYAGFAPGFTQNGYVFRYTKNAMLIDSLQVGIAPANFSFR